MHIESVRPEVKYGSEVKYKSGVFPGVYFVVYFLVVGQKHVFAQGVHLEAEIKR